MNRFQSLTEHGRKTARGHRIGGLVRFIKTVPEKIKAYKEIAELKTMGLEVTQISAYTGLSYSAIDRILKNQASLTKKFRVNCRCCRTLVDLTTRTLVRGLCWPCHHAIHWFTKNHESLKLDYTNTIFKLLKKEIQENEEIN